MTTYKNPFENKKVSVSYKDTETIYRQSASLILEFLAQSLNIDKYWFVVDLGAGTGILDEELLKKGFKNITLVEPSEAMLEESKAKLGTQVKYIQNSAENIDKNFSANIDLLFVMNALHLLPALDPALTAISKSLKPKGYFVFNSTAPSFAFEGTLSETEKSLIKANIEFYAGLAALSSNEITIKTKELLELYLEGNFASAYKRSYFKEILPKYSLTEKAYTEIVIKLEKSKQKSIWMMIGSAFVQEIDLLEKLINSIELQDELEIRQACFLYEKTGL